jgi:tetratricopeptide (TPR) repeat protein
LNSKLVVLEPPFVYLSDHSDLVPVGFMKTTLILVVFCTLAAFSDGSAQIPRKATDKPASPKPATGRRERSRPRPAAASTTAAATESYNFFDLAQRFREERKWNAAEAAYKESIQVWSGNADALLELGFLYIDRNRLPEAQAVYSKLRAVDSSFAAELLADINRYKAAIR